MNVSTYRSKSSNWVRVTLVTLLLILGLVIGICSVARRRDRAPARRLCRPSSRRHPALSWSRRWDRRRSGSTGSSGDSDTSEPVPEPEPEPEPDPTRTRWDPTTWRRTPSPSLTRIRWDPTTWRRIPIPEVNSRHSIPDSPSSSSFGESGIGA